MRAGSAIRLREPSGAREGGPFSTKPARAAVRGAISANGAPEAPPDRGEYDELPESPSRGKDATRLGAADACSGCPAAFLSSSRAYSSTASEFAWQAAIFSPSDTCSQASCHVSLPTKSTTAFISSGMAGSCIGSEYVGWIFRSAAFFQASVFCFIMSTVSSNFKGCAFCMLYCQTNVQILTPKPPRFFELAVPGLAFAKRRLFAPRGRICQLGRLPGRPGRPAESRN